MKYALIKDNLVVNVIELDGFDIVQSNTAKIGDSYYSENNQFFLLFL